MLKWTLQQCDFLHFLPFSMLFQRAIKNNQTAANIVFLSQSETEQILEMLHHHSKNWNELIMKTMAKNVNISNIPYGNPAMEQNINRPTKKYNKEIHQPNSNTYTTFPKVISEPEQEKYILHMRSTQNTVLLINRLNWLLNVFVCSFYNHKMSNLNYFLVFKFVLHSNTMCDLNVKIRPDWLYLIFCLVCFSPEWCLI